jgi:hypothetical protein
MSNLWSGTRSTINNTNSVTTSLYGGLANTQGAASSYSTNKTPSAIPTNIIQFAPSISANFQFKATLDGLVYNVVVTYNIYGERYYINIYDTSNTLILCMPLIGSPLEYNISLTAGYFTTMLIYREPNRQFEII